MQHLSDIQIDRCRRRALEPGEMREVYAHLDLCDECRAKVRREGAQAVPFARFRAEHLLGEWIDPLHLTVEQQADYVDGTLDRIDRQIVESHLETCPQCVEEIRELRAFRTMLTTYPAVEVAPLTRPTWTERLAAAFRIPDRRFAWRATAAVVLTAAIAFGVGYKIRGAQPSPGVVATADAEALKAARADAERYWQQAQQARTEADLKGKRLDAERRTLALTKTELDAARKQASLAVARGSWQEIRRFAGGERLVKDRRGTLLRQIPLLPADAATLATLKPNPPKQIARLIGPGGTTMGGSDSQRTFALLGPVGTFVLSGRPTFAWKPVKGAAKYAVRVLDSDSNTRAAADIEKTEWTPPPSATLKPGQVYIWSVDALSARGEKIATAPGRGSSKFEVLTPQAVRQIEKARRRYAGSALLLGVFYANRGLLDDARRELQAHLAANPSDANARKILHNLEAMRRSKGP